MRSAGPTEIDALLPAGAGASIHSADHGQDRRALAG